MTSLLEFPNEILAMLVRNTLTLEDYKKIRATSHEFRNQVKAHLTHLGTNKEEYISVSMVMELPRLRSLSDKILVVINSKSDLNEIIQHPSLKRASLDLTTLIKSNINPSYLDFIRTVLVFNELRDITYGDRFNLAMMDGDFLSYISLEYTSIRVNLPSNAENPRNISALSELIREGKWWNYIGDFGLKYPKLLGNSIFRVTIPNYTGRYPTHEMIQNIQQYDGYYHPYPKNLVEIGEEIIRGFTERLLRFSSDEITKIYPIHVEYIPEVFSAFPNLKTISVSYISCLVNEKLAKSILKNARVDEIIIIADAEGEKPGKSFLGEFFTRHDKVLLIDSWTQEEINF